jgi:hypothetical protein
MPARDRILWGAAVSILFLVYVTSGPRTLPEADAGELAAIAVRGGIPHPPGYPLLSWILQGFATLAGPLGLIPALALSSILCACVAAVLIAHTLIARGTPAISAWTATLAVFLSVHVWRDATTFEPFALNLLLAAGVIACTERLARDAAGTDRARTLFALGGLFGLGLCNHHTLALFAPLPLAVLLAQPRRLLGDARFLTLGFVLGTTPLLLLLVQRTQPGFIWGDWDPFLPRLLTHLLRHEYGTLSLAPSGAGSLAYGPARMLATLPQGLSYAFAGLLLFGVLHGLRRWYAARQASPSHTDRFAFGLGASFVCSGLLFPMLFRLHGLGLDDLIADRFLALPMLPLAFPLATGLTALSPVLRALHAPVCAALLLAHGALQWPAAARAEHHFFEDHVRNIFDIVERDAVLMTASDTGFSAGLYGRYVLGRDDVTVVLSRLSHGWYTARVRAELVRPGTTLAARPLYVLDPPKTQARPALAAYPIGPLLRVIQLGEAMPSSTELFARNQALFARLRLPTRAQIARMDPWEQSELVNYTRGWHELGTRLRREGHDALSAQALRYRDAFVR